MSDDQTIHDPYPTASVVRSTRSPCPRIHSGLMPPDLMLPGVPAPTGPLPPGVHADPASLEEWRMEREALLNDPEASPDNAEALLDDAEAWREEQRDACALLIGEAVRLAAVVDTMGPELVMRGVPAERALGERLVRLYDGLGPHAKDGSGAAAMVRDRLAPVVLRLQAAALDEAVGRVRALAEIGGSEKHGPGGTPTLRGPHPGGVR